MSALWQRFTLDRTSLIMERKPCTCLVSVGSIGQIEVCSPTLFHRLMVVLEGNMDSPLQMSCNHSIIKGKEVLKSENRSALCFLTEQSLSVNACHGIALEQSAL